MIVFILAPLLIALTYAVPIDNGVVGYPHVTCGEHSIMVQVDTQRPFQGRVYIKNEVHRPECVWGNAPATPAMPTYATKPPTSEPYSSYGTSPHARSPSPAAYSSPPRTGYPRGKKISKRQVGYGARIPEASYNTVGDSVSVDVKFGQCNMRRQRTLEPRGVEYTFTMVVSFHRVFLTKIDRAYRIRCFYMEAVKTVNAQLDVSMITTQSVNQQYPMPQCFYHLKKGYGGEYARFARVGEKIVHKWECTPPQSAYIFGMLVHSCYVDDGAGNKVQLIDQNGCAVDRYLVPQIQYDDKLFSAHVETHVFKYADKNNLFFQCAIQLCFKADGGCYGISPPKCPEYGAPAETHNPVSAHAPSQPTPYHPPPAAPAGAHPVAPQYPPQSSPGAGPKPYEGVFNPPLSPIDPRELPYRDEPSNQSASSNNKKQKRAVDSSENPSVNMSPVASQRKNALLETDVIAAPLVVLPFDAVEQAEMEGLNSEEGHRQIIDLLPRGAILTQAHRLSPDGFCVSSVGASLLATMFVVLFISATAMAVVLVRRQSTLFKA